MWQSRCRCGSCDASGERRCTLLQVLWVRCTLDQHGHVPRGRQRAARLHGSEVGEHVGRGVAERQERDSCDARRRSEVSSQVWPMLQQRAWRKRVAAARNVSQRSSRKQRWADRRAAGPAGLGCKRGLHLPPQRAAARKEWPDDAHDGSGALRVKSAGSGEGAPKVSVVSRAFPKLVRKSCPHAGPRRMPTVGVPP